MKLSTIANDLFAAAMRKLSNAELPIQTSWKIKGLVPLLDAERKKYDEIRTTLVQKYAAKDENGEIQKKEDGSYQVAPENQAPFFEELNSLLDVEVAVGTIRLAELGDKVNLSVAELIALGDFLVE